MKLKLWSVQKNGGTDAEGPSPPAAAAAAAAQLGVCRLSFPGRTATDYPAIQNTHTQCTKSSRALFSLTNVTGSGNICRKTSFYPSTFLLVGLKLCQVSYFWSFLCVCVCNGQLSETLLFMWCTCTREETKSASEQVRNTP